MDKNITLKTAIALTVLSLASFATASTQTISARDSSGYDTTSGESFDIPLDYTSDSANLAGLGVSLAFDSTKLAFQGFSSASTLDKDLLAADTTATNDSANLDQDDSTDKLVTIAWASLNGDWPGTTSTPLTTARFKVLDSASSDSAINITGNAASNTTFSSSPIVVRIEKNSEQPSPSTQTNSGGGGSFFWYLFPLLIFLKGIRKRLLVL